MLTCCLRRNEMANGGLHGNESVGLTEFYGFCADCGKEPMKKIEEGLYECSACGHKTKTKLVECVVEQIWKN